MPKQLRKESGFTIIELLIVIAIIGILATLVLTNFQGAQAKGRDTVRKNDINSLYQMETIDDLLVFFFTDGPN